MALKKINKVGTPQNTLPGVNETRRTCVSVFYWSQYDSGERYIYDVELLAPHSIKDLIHLSIAHFTHNGALSDTRVDNYLLRAADKRTKPKTHFPAFGLSEKVIDTQITRFALCSRRLDEDAKRKLEGDSIEDETDTVFTPVTINTPVVTDPHTPAQQPRRFCCCQVS